MLVVNMETLILSFMLFNVVVRVSAVRTKILLVIRPIKEVVMAFRRGGRRRFSRGRRGRVRRGRSSRARRVRVGFRM